MTDDTANLQSEPKTVKELATHLGVSERQMYKLKLVFTYRPDLADKVAAKEMSLHAAWLETTGREKDTSRRRLVRAWKNATEVERAELIAHIREKGYRYRSLERIKSETAICLPDETANLQSNGEDK
jgi:hypothetical protein